MKNINVEQRIEGFGMLGVIVAIVGGIFAAIGFFQSVGSDPYSAPQQTVAALWTIEGILGILVSSIGLLILTGTKLVEPILRIIERVDHTQPKPTDDDEIADRVAPAAT